VPLSKRFPNLREGSRHIRRVCGRGTSCFVLSFWVGLSRLGDRALTYNSLVGAGDRLRRRIGRGCLLYLERALKACEIINRCMPAVAYIVAALTSTQRRWRGHLQKPKAVKLYHGLFCVVGGCRLCEALERGPRAAFGLWRCVVGGFCGVVWGSAVGNYWRGGRLCREVLRLSVASSTLRPRDGAG
jgi:hypothetical protein